MIALTIVLTKEHDTRAYTLHGATVATLRHPSSGPPMAMASRFRATDTARQEFQLLAQMADEDGWVMAFPVIEHDVSSWGYTRLREMTLNTGWVPPTEAEIRLLLGQA